MRPIRKTEIRLEGDEIRFYGAALRLLKRLARLASRREGHTVSPNQVAEGLVAGIQKPIGLHADLVRALDKIRQILEKLRQR